MIKKLLIIGTAVAVTLTTGYLLLADTEGYYLKTTDIPVKKVVEANSVTNTVSTPFLPVKNEIPFVVAPDYNDIQAAALLIANATNQKIEQEWIKTRLGTRLARESKEREKAKLDKAKFAHERAILELKTEGIADGVYSQLPEPSSDNYLSKVTSNIVSNSADNILSTPGNEPDVKLLGFTKSKRNQKSKVDLKVNGKIYPNMSSGHSLKGLLIAKLSDSTRCVTLTYQSNNNTLCME